MKQSITIKLKVWIICAVFLLTNLITIGIWQPWSSSKISTRTIAITGATTIESEPDQFTFTPYYQEDGADKTAINTEFSNLSKIITSKLQGIGVKDSAIKVDVNLYDYSVYQDDPGNNAVATMYITATVKDKDLAQRVQDYLATTSPAGSITPQVSFSVVKQKALEIQARYEALKDAKSKAEATAKQLNTKLGRVVKISDITSGGITPLPWMAKSSSEINSVDSSTVSPSYAIQPGLNDYSFSIEITYELN